MHYARLVLCTKNPGKIRELKALMSGHNVEVTGLDPQVADVEETGTTFEENALLKARAGCLETALPALGEDSGLVVDALGGEPGIWSSRWAPGSDSDRMYALLKRMEGIPADQRTARYVSCIAIAMPHGTEQTVRGELEGLIAFEPRGDGGFGYDPIFMLSDGQMVAEISLEEKNRISHRAKALQQAIPLLTTLLGGGEA